MERRNNGSLISPATATEFLPASAEAHPQRAADAAADSNAATAAFRAVVAVTKKSSRHFANKDKAVAGITATSPTKMIQKQWFATGAVQRLSVFWTKRKNIPQLETIAISHLKLLLQPEISHTLDPSFLSFPALSAGAYTTTLVVMEAVVS